MFFLESKNTLSFLNECKKTINKEDTKERKKPGKKYIDDEDKTKRINRLMERIKNKDEIIYDLESKLYSQESKLKKINYIMDSQDGILSTSIQL